MNSFSNSSIRLGLLLMIFIFMARLHKLEAKLAEEESMMNTRNNDNEDEMEQAQQNYDLKKLRNFLLTANAAKLAAKRKHQEMLKKELIQEYLQSLSDPNAERFEEIKKRFKTYCNSYEDLMNSNWAACG